MNSEISKAKEILAQETATCAIVHDSFRYISHKRGVAPLMDALESGNVPEGSSLADRVIGNGAAFLCVLLKIREIWTPVISEPALKTLGSYGIACTYETLVRGIVNRKGNGPCPMEDAVKDISSPNEALTAIKSRLESLKANPL